MSNHLKIQLYAKKINAVRLLVETARRLQRNRITTFQRPLLVFAEDQSSNQLDNCKGTELYAKT